MVMVCGSRRCGWLQPRWRRNRKVWQPAADVKDNQSVPIPSRSRDLAPEKQGENFTRSLAGVNLAVLMIAGVDLCSHTPFFLCFRQRST